jgi:hypothetical protein
VLAQDRRQVGAHLRLGGGKGRPLQQVAAADQQPPQRAQDRVGRHQGLLAQLLQAPQAADHRAQQVDAGQAVEVPLGQVVAAGRQTGHGAHQRAGPQGGQHQAQGGQWRQCRIGQRERQQRQRHRRHQRAAQVVEQLPAVDRAHRVAPGLQQQRQQLPVAAGPAVQAGGGHVGVERGVLDHRDVRHRGTTHQRAFEQVVAQHLIVG